MILGAKNYLELYRFHDYFQYKDKNVDTVLSANYKTEFQTSQNIVLGVNENTKEIALGDKADIKTTISRINRNSFEILREIDFKNILSNSETLYFNLIVGGEDITFQNNELVYSECKVRIEYPSEVNLNYKPTEKAITFSQKIENKNIKFKITFNINCG